MAERLLWVPQRLQGQRSTAQTVHSPSTRLAEEEGRAICYYRQSPQKQPQKSPPEAGSDVTRGTGERRVQHAARRPRLETSAPDSALASPPSPFPSDRTGAAAVAEREAPLRYGAHVFARGASLTKPGSAWLQWQSWKLTAQWHCQGCPAPTGPRRAPAAHA